MIKSIKKYNVWIFLGLFCILYNPPILPINSMHVVGALSLYCLIRQSERFPIIVFSKSIFTMLCSFLFVFIYLLMVAVLSKNGDVGIAIYPIYFLIDIIPFGVVLKRYSFNKKLNIDDFLNLVIGCGIIQAIFGIMAMLFPMFQDFLMDFFIRYGYDEVYVAISTYRMYGFAGSLTFSTPILQSVLGIIAIVHFRGESIKCFFIASTLLLSAVINARTSIVVIMVGVVVVILLSKLPLKYKIGFFVAIPLIIVMVGIVIVPILSEIAPQMVVWITTGMEEITGLFTGDIEEGYFAYLIDSQKYVIPEGLMQQLFGVGHAVQGGQMRYGVSSDIGYINDIWRGGIIYVIIVYGYVLGRLKKIAKSNTETIGFIGLFIGIVCLVVNMKGTIFSMNDLTSFICLLYIMLFVPTSYCRKNIKK